MSTWAGRQGKCGASGSPCTEELVASKVPAQLGSRERDSPSLQRCRPDDTGKESLHTRREQGGVGSDPPPGLAIQRARVCGFEAHMLARAAPKVGLTHGIPTRGKEGRRVLNSGPGISGGRTVRVAGETFSGSSHPALHGAPV